MSQQSIKNVVIVGGGTAGWLSAGVLAAKLGQQSLQQASAINVTLVESPEVSTIGVGEGSWPSLRDTLLDIGIKESEFITQCHASYKQGSTFSRWKYDDKPHQYQHPFTTPSGYVEMDIHAQWQNLCAEESFEQSFCIQPEMCDLGKAPKQVKTPDYAYVLNYGYHFDATALAHLLTNHCVSNLGVNHIKAHISSVNSAADGNIASLTTNDGDVIEGDLFIDCSGGKALLIGEHFGVNWRSMSGVLMNNRAMAVQVPYEDSDNDISSTTIATGKPFGWTWDIGLQHRRGVGMVYNDQFASSDQVQSTLLAHVGERASQATVDQCTVRSLSFDPGYREQFWVKNCLSLGMSSGFIEPLEASAIAMIELGLRMLYEQFPKDMFHMERLSKRYNDRFTYRWERVIDFLKLHYILSERSDPYWLAQRDPMSIPDSLKEMMEMWKYQPPSRFDFIQNEEIFPSASYQYVLYGMGYHTQVNHLLSTTPEAKKAMAIRKQLEQQRPQFMAGLPTNRQLLDQLVAMHSK